MPSTGSRGVKIFPRSKKYLDKFDSIFDKNEETKKSTSNKNKNLDTTKQKK